MELVKILLIVLAILLGIRLLSLPIRWIFRLLLSTAAGFLLLAAFNYFGAYVGLQIGINVVNVLAVGILGIPGLAALLLIRWILTV